MPDEQTLPSGMCPVPAGRELPATLGRFLALLLESGIHPGQLEASWEDLSGLMSVHDSAREALWPFYVLGDGGRVALWWEHDEPCVVRVGSEGDFSVVARDFDELLMRLVLGESGVEDLDEDLRALPIATLLPGKTRPQPLGSAPSKRFEHWIATHSSLLAPLRSDDARKLRGDVLAMAERMLDDGLSKVYKTRAQHWSFHFKLLRDGSQWRVEYLDYGEWYPVPAQYGAAELAARLVALTKHPDRDLYELSAGKSGIVSIDRDKELLLRSDSD